MLWIILSIFFPALCLLLKSYQIQKASSNAILFSAIYIVSTSRTVSSSETPRARLRAILCMRGHLIHTEFQWRNYPRLACQVTRFTLRLFAVPPARTSLKDGKCDGVARKVRRFRQNGRPVRKFNNGEKIIRPDIRGDVVVSPARERTGRRVPREIYSPRRSPPLQWGGEIENQYSKGIECSTGLTNGPRARRMAKILLYIQGNNSRLKTLRASWLSLL